MARTNRAQCVGSLGRWGSAAASASCATYNDANTATVDVPTSGLSCLSAAAWSRRSGESHHHGLRAYPGWVAARVARWAFLYAMRPLASCRRARWFSSFLDQRMRMPRFRFSQE